MIAPLLQHLCITLAQTTAGDGYSYTRPFVQPLPLWDKWYLWLLPLCAAVAIVYKTIRCRTMRRVPYEASVIFVMIVGGLILCAAVLSGLSYWF